MHLTVCCVLDWQALVIRKWHSEPSSEESPAGQCDPRTIQQDPVVFDTDLASSGPPGALRGSLHMQRASRGSTFSKRDSLSSQGSLRGTASPAPEQGAGLQEAGPMQSALGSSQTCSSLSGLSSGTGKLNCAREQGSYAWAKPGVNASSTVLFSCAIIDVTIPCPCCRQELRSGTSHGTGNSAACSIDQALCRGHPAAAGGKPAGKFAA